MSGSFPAKLLTRQSRNHASIISAVHLLPVLAWFSACAPPFFPPFLNYAYRIHDLQLELALHSFPHPAPEHEHRPLTNQLATGGTVAGLIHNHYPDSRILSWVAIERMRKVLRTIRALPPSNPISLSLSLV
jgi:hypothetical protein